VARFGLAIGLTGFGAVVFLRVQQRVEPVAALAVDRLDPDAVIESTGVELVRTAGGEENFALTGNRQQTFEDGSMRFFEGMSLKVTEQLDRESFIVTGIEASMDDAQTEFTVSGDVQLTVSDGLMVRTGALAFARGQSLVTMIDGPVPTAFNRSGLEASGRNPTYDRDRAITNLPEAALVRLTGDGDREAVDIESARATLAHDDRYMRFEGGTTAATGPLVLESENMTAHFGEEETALERIELRGLADIRSINPTAGGLRAMRADDMTLEFESTSRVLKRALLAGKATIELVGTDGNRGARISAMTMHATLAPDGGDVTALEAWDAVRLQLPDTPDGARQDIRAGRLTPDGPPGSEMTAVRFEQDVVYQERRTGVGSAAASRVIRADRLEAGVKEGLSALLAARFLGHVSFDDDRRAATASEVVYDVTGGLVTLNRAPDARLTPSVTDTTSRIEAGTITLAVDGSMLEASGGVTSVLTPEGAGDDDAATSTSRQLPALLDEDQQVLVSAAALRHDADVGQTTYRGQAHLWQGGTSFEGDTLEIDDQTGNLTASGNVRTRIQLMRLNESTQRSEVSSTRVEASTVVYDSVERHAVYDTKALLRSDHGNLIADTIEVFLATDDRTLDRLEATGNVTLGLDGRWATGDHLVYYEAEGRYEMEGSLVKIVEEVEPVETATTASTQPGATPQEPSCSSTTGRTLAFFRSTDTVTVDGREVARTQTRSGTCKPPTF
jgi:lipopolysaccharide export system protein LptA